MSERFYERSVPVAEALPKGIEILIEKWQPKALNIAENELMQLVRERYGEGISASDAAKAKEFILSDLLKEEWDKMLKEKFPDRVTGSYVKTPRFNTDNDPDIPWHRDGEGQKDFQDVLLILWSNRETTEVRDYESKHPVKLSRSAVVTVDNEKYEHRRPTKLSADRYFCHAGIAKIKLNR